MSTALEEPEEWNKNKLVLYVAKMHQQGIQHTFQILHRMVPALRYWTDWLSIVV